MFAPFASAPCDFDTAGGRSVWENRLPSLGALSRRRRAARRGCPDLRGRCASSFATSATLDVGHSNHLRFNEVRPEKPDHIPSRRLWGSSLSGGHAFAVAATDPRIAAVIARAGMLSLMNANAPRRMAWRVIDATEVLNHRFSPRGAAGHGCERRVGLDWIGAHPACWWCTCVSMVNSGRSGDGTGAGIDEAITDAARAGDVKTLADC